MNDYNRLLVVKVENRMGISFNNRPCSNDECIEQHLNDVISECTPRRFYARSKDEMDLLIAENSCGVFVSDIFDPSPCLDYFDGIILYGWNRDYPSDIKFTSDLSEFTCVSIQDFAGKSHEKITESVYLRIFKS